MRALVPSPTSAISLRKSSAFLQPIVCAAALPVLLTNFTVVANGRSATIRWQTASEQQSSHYEIEASADGRNLPGLQQFEVKMLLPGQNTA